MEAKTYESWLYPDHDIGGGTHSRTEAISSWPAMLSDHEYVRLISHGFSPLTTSASDGFKRTDDKGRAILIYPCCRVNGKWRVEHRYEGFKVSTTFDITASYANDILKGRDNDWFFVSYPEEDV